MLKPKTLQQRLLLFMLLPVAVLLTAMGLVVFIYARSTLLAQWKEAAILKLERAAHDVDMRLRSPKGWMKMYHGTAGEPGADSVREWLVRQLENVDGVERVAFTRMEKEFGEGSRTEEWYTRRPNAGDHRMMRWMGMMDFHRGEIAEITPPRYDSLVEHETISLTSDLLDKSGGVLGRLQVVTPFHYLIEGTIASGWSQNEKAFLVSDTGEVLACNIEDKAEQLRYDKTVQTAINAMQSESFGTIIGPDHSKGEVVGFFKLKEAPWSLVLVARREEILAPVSHFRMIYSVTAAAFFFFILLLIRLVAGRTVSSIRDVSDAAGRVAQGRFDALPPVKSRDEVGQLIQSFNEMVLQLDERIRLKEALDLAMQVQQNLLPEKPPRIDGLDIAGESIYCDETGGDYYDFLSFSSWDSERVGIAVGDVAGHGISAALFMTTARALLRGRIIQSGSLSDVVTDVNRLLCLDTSRTGDFMSLFLALADLRTNTIRWVRAGHAPAIVYDWTSDSFEELRGDGVALGFDAACSFKEYEYSGWGDTKILFLGTDGIWETENPQGDMFGMDRLRTVIRQHCQASPGEIIRAVKEALANFRQTRPQEDDVTLVVMKAAPH